VITPVLYSEVPAVDLKGRSIVTEYSNILIIKPGAIGDLLHLTPVIRMLSRRFSNAKITLLVGSPLTAALFAHHPGVYETIVFDKTGTHSTFRALVSLRRRLKESHYDLILNFQRSNLKLWFLALAALTCRVLIYHKTRTRKVHAVINHLETVYPLGIQPDDMHLDLFLSPADEEYATKVIEAHSGPLIAMNPGASNRIKCWSPQRFAELADRLSADLGAGVVIVGAQNERDLGDAICAGMQTAPVNLLGKTDLLQLGAILKRCDVLVSGDTGPLHMATAVGTPAVALFGAIDPGRTGPVGEGHRVIRHEELGCVPCNAKRCRNRRYLECMEMISVDEVFWAVAQILEERKSAFRISHKQCTNESFANNTQFDLMTKIWSPTSDVLSG